MSEVLRHLEKMLAEDVAIEAEQMGYGGATDWPDYKRRQGIIQGLDKARGRIVEIQNHLKTKGVLDDDET